MIKVCEIYKSIIGEGSLSGKPAVILRLTGCNLRCSWCDTSYAYKEGEEIELSNLIEQVSAFKMKRILITGGEPIVWLEDPE